MYKQMGSKASAENDAFFSFVLDLGEKSLSLEMSLGELWTIFDAQLELILSSCSPNGPAVNWYKTFRAVCHNTRAVAGILVQ